MDEPRGHRRESGGPPEPNYMVGMILCGGGLRRHGPASVVGAPRRSYGYVVVTPPRIRGRGVRNAARCITTTGCGGMPIPAGGSR